jgi:GH24 family phage-related lysozyme (muramidase)
MTLATNQSRLRRWGFLTDTSAGYGPNTEAAYTLALNRLEDFVPLAAGSSGSFPITKLPANTLSVRGAAEIIEHESIVLEAYYDNAKPPVLTWGIGVTNASGHKVDGYKDNPQTIAKVLEVYLWLLKKTYIPHVLQAFEGFPLNEHQMAAALSFHYNTGAIRKTEWVGMVKAGKLAEARAFLVSHYLNGGALLKRRKLEAALFFDGAWTTDGKVTVLGVSKPSYTPNWSSAKSIDIIPVLTALMGAA